MVRRDTGDTVRPSSIITKHELVEMLARAVLESGQLSTWLTRQLRERDLPVICVDARQAHKALSARLNKSDSADAESPAQLARTGWFREVHVKSPEADRLRVVLAARRRLISCRKDIEAQLRGTLKTFGIKLGVVTAGHNLISFRDKVRSALNNDQGLLSIVEPLLLVHEGICLQSSKLDRAVGAIARRSPIAKRLMTVSGVGIVTALTFMSVIDTPARFRKSSDAAAYIGLTPRRYQSGQVDYSGRISRSGNSELRACLYEAGCTVLNHTKKFSALKSWGLRLAARKGFRKAAVAVARKIAVIMHRIWSDGTVFEWSSRKSDVAVT